MREFLKESALPNCNSLSLGRSECRGTPRPATMSGIQWQWLPGNWEMKKRSRCGYFGVSVAFSGAVGGYRAPALTLFSNCLV